MLIVGVCQVGCSLMGMFDKPPLPCEPGTFREVGSCGVCMSGVSVEQCNEDRLWVEVSCRDEADRDGDGYPNEICDTLREGCCTDLRDCNDESPNVHPETYDCVFRERAEEVPDEMECQGECGAVGIRTCTSDCIWGACTLADETCNGEDDDCDGVVDDGFACSRGRAEACVTPCGSLGSITCTTDCFWGNCLPPTEICNGVDDDCDGDIDDGFECLQHEFTSCNVGGCPGERRCSDECQWEDCAPTDSLIPSTPSLLAPENGQRTGSHLNVSALRPTFRWSSIEGHCDMTYELAVDDSCSPADFDGCDFPSPEVYLEVPDTSATLEIDLPVDELPPAGRRYFWRVRACDVFDRCGDWSHVRYLDVGKELNDFNGDGYADVLIGAPESDLGGVDSGRFTLYRGSGTFDGTPAATGVGSSVGDRLGRALAGVGDVDGDGFADYVVGAPGRGSSTGHAWLVLGGETLTAEPDVVLSLSGGVEGYRLGFSVAAAGDVDADGFADIIIGVPGFDSETGEGGFDVGLACLYRGGPIVSSIPAAIFMGSFPQDGFGSTVAGAGDFDGDGYADVIVGAPTDNSVHADAGSAHIFFGGESMESTADVVFTGSVPGGQLGRGLATAGDINGDGSSDVLLGTPHSGEVDIHFGGDSYDSTADVTLVEVQVGEAFGWSVASGGDVNGDGWTDVVVGAPLRGGAGVAALFLGGVAMDRTPVVELEGSGAQIGYSVAHAGDIDADGYDDVLIAAPFFDGAAGATVGQVLILWGADDLGSPTTLSLEGIASGERFGMALGGAP